jgi:hypothetical protein
VKEKREVVDRQALWKVDAPQIGAISVESVKVQLINIEP